MHQQAHDFVARFATDDKVSVIEIGSRDINGNVRGLFPNATYVGVDIRAGNGVDVVADATVWAPKKPVDLVICCELIEHCETWADVLGNAATMLKKGGRMVVTGAGPGRASHSAEDGGPLHAGEWYSNIDPDDLEAVLSTVLVDVEVEVVGTDVRGSGIRG